MVQRKPIAYFLMLSDRQENYLYSLKGIEKLRPGFGPPPPGNIIDCGSRLAGIGCGSRLAAS